VGRWAKQIQTQLKIPAIGIASNNVVHYAIDYNFKFGNGMPIRYVAVPFPFTGQPKAVDVGYVTGKDMLSSQPLMTAITKALTDPLTAEEKISDAAPVEPGNRGFFRRIRRKICAACSRATAGPITTGSRCPPKSASSKC